MRHCCIPSELANWPCQVLLNHLAKTKALVLTTPDGKTPLSRASMNTETNLFAWGCKPCTLSLPIQSSILWRQCFPSHTCLAPHLCNKICNKHMFLCIMHINLFYNLTSDMLRCIYLNTQISKNFWRILFKTKQNLTAASLK